MPESEASGEATVDDPIDDPIDADRVAARSPDTADDDSAAPGEFGYLFDGPDYADHGAGERDPAAEYPAVDPGRPEAAATPSGEARFDAFNSDTWNFQPAPTPWHQTRQNVVVLTVVAIAVIALIVSVVLLVFRGSPDDQVVPAIESSATPTTATTTAEVVSTSEVPPPLPPPPPPPPPPPSEPEVDRAPVVVRPQPTKKPELNVTRSPISVSPKMPTGLP